MGDEVSISNPQGCHKPESQLYEFDTGALCFKVKSIQSVGLLTFYGKLYPHKKMFSISIGSRTGFTDFANTQDYVSNNNLALPHDEYAHYFILIWKSFIIIGDGETKEVMYKFDRQIEPSVQHLIGFFKTDDVAQWIFEAPPPRPEPRTLTINNKWPRWVAMTDEDNLPIDSFIGGLEVEPLYVARAQHNGSLAPGKYMRSTKLAYVPWGQWEHPKMDFEILCGYNFEWVPETTAGLREYGAPPNAFVAGYSEVDLAPLYVGRANHDGHLVVGKVHMIYHTCYLPYKGKEVEASNFEILVSKNVEPRGVILKDFLCS